MLVLNRCPGLTAPAAQVAHLVHALDQSGRFRIPPGELSIVLLDADAMTEVHRDFLDDPSPTDVITFDGDPAFASAGEICVCAELAWAYAATHDKDPAAELALYLAHGYLHLAGFDDTAPVVRRRMRAAEKEALAVLHAAHAIPRFAWRRSRRVEGSPP